MISNIVSCTKSLLGATVFDLALLDNLAKAFISFSYSKALVKASTKTCSTPILVCGKRIELVLRERFTFSPNANLIKPSAPLIFISSGLAPQRIFIKAD